MIKIYLYIIWMALTIVAKTYAEDPNKVDAIELKGNVVDESNDPIEGVEVEIYNVHKNQNNVLGIEVDTIGTVQSDSEGLYQIPVKNSSMVAREQFAVLYKDGYALGIGQHLSHGYEFDQVTLSKKHTDYSGIVKDSEGNPVQGATVYALLDNIGTTAVDLTLECAMTKRLNTKTDKNGVFQFTNIPLSAKAEFVAVGKGYANAFTWETEMGLYPSMPAGKDNVEITMHKTGKILGALLEKNTLVPIPNEKVYMFRLTPSRVIPYITYDHQTGEVYLPETFENDSVEFTTDENGLFIADKLTPGDYGLSLYSLAHKNRNWSSVKQIVTVPEGSVKEVIIKAVKTAQVKIQVVNKEEDSASVEGVSVKVVPTKLDDEYIQEIAPLKTDKAGNVFMNLSPGAYEITALTKKNYINMEPESQTFVVADGDEVDIEAHMVYSPGFWGICRDDSGSPVSGAEISIANLDVVIAPSDADGLFSISPDIIKQFEDDMVIMAYQKDRKLGGMLLKDRSWSDELLQIQMKEVKTVTGKLVNGDMSPIANGHISLLADRDTGSYSQNKKINVVADTQTDETGTFSFDILDEEYDYAIQANMEGVDKRIIPIESYSIKQQNIGNIVIEASNLSISGTLIDHMGYPIGGIQLQFLDEEMRKNHPEVVITDPNGKFQFNNLAQGEYLIDTNYKWNLIQHGRFKAGTSGNRFIVENKITNGRWDFPRSKDPIEGASVEVKIVDARTGEPVTGKGSYVEFEGNSINNLFVHPDSSGTVHVNLDAGHYKLSSDRYPDYQRTRIEIDVEVGGKYEYELALNSYFVLKGMISDINGNPIEEANFKIYPMEDYSIEGSNVLGNGSYELSWSEEKGSHSRQTYLFIENEEIQYGRFYAISSDQTQLDIVLEPSAFVVLGSEERVRLAGRFYNKQWEDYSNLSTWLNFKRKEEDGVYKFTGIYPIPEELEYLLSTSNRNSKAVVIKSDEIVSGEQLNINLE